MMMIIGWSVLLLIIPCGVLLVGWRRNLLADQPAPVAPDRTPAPAEEPAA